MFVPNPGYAVHKVVNPSETVAKNTELKHQLTVEDILTKNRKAIERKIGKKLKLKERLALKLMKRNLKKQLKKGKSKEELKAALANDNSNFNIGAFFLGFLLGLIGILLAYIFMRDHVRSAWIGFGIWIAILLIVLVV